MVTLHLVIDETGEWDGTSWPAVDDLFRALVAMRTCWREDHEVYSVDVMNAFGLVIEELEKLVDFGEEGPDAYPLPYPVAEWRD